MKYHPQSNNIFKAKKCLRHMVRCVKVIFLPSSFSCHLLTLFLLCYTWTFLAFLLLEYVPLCTIRPYLVMFFLTHLYYSISGTYLSIRGTTFFVSSCFIIISLAKDLFGWFQRHFCTTCSTFLLVNLFQRKSSLNGLKR